MKTIKLINRNQSVITEEKKLEKLYQFKKFPVFFGCVLTSPKKDLKADMGWAICSRSGVIQLDKLIPLDILYQAQHVDGTGPTWQKYYHDFAKYIKLQKPKHVLEIGGGAGDLAKIFINTTKNTDWTIVEPNPLIKNSQRIKVKSAFFDEKFKIKSNPDTVVFSQVLEHAYDPRGFIKNIADFLKPGQKLIFAYPNLKLWLQRKYTNAINFEHTMFLTDYWVDYLLKLYGFKIENKIEYKDHSYFYCAVKLEKPNKIAFPKSKYKQYKKIFNDFIDYHQKLVEKLNKKIAKFDGEVYVFGAHIFSQYLLEFGLNKKKITALLDNSNLKIGKRLYGSDLWVKAPQIIKDKKKIAVVLKVGIYRDEILKQLKTINPKVVIFE